MCDIRLKDGTGQNDRKIRVFEPDFYNIDEYTIEKLIALTVDYSKHLNYYNSSNMVSGSWENFLIHDEIIINALIQETDIEYIEKRFLNDYQNQFRDKNLYNTLIDYIMILAEKINRWYTSLYLSYDQKENRLLRLLYSVIKGKLSIKFTYVDQILKNLENSKYKIASFDKIWFCEEKRIKAINEEFSDYDRNIINNLHNIFYSFRNAIEYIRKISGALYNDLNNTGTHSPSTALFLTFLRLYKYPQNAINQLTRKYIDFYFYDVLQTKKNNSKPDDVHLVFEISDNLDYLKLPKTTQFVFQDKNSNAELIYSLEKDILINKSVIAKIYTVFKEKNRLISPEAEFNMATNIKLNEIPVISHDEIQNNNFNLYSVFGQKNNVTSIDSAKYYEPGFIIESPQLLLYEGDRIIEIEFHFTNESYRSFKEECDRISSLLNSELGENNKEVFLELLSSMFKISLTAENGWLELNNYNIKSDLTDSEMQKNTFNIKIELSREMPSIVWYDEIIHKFNINACYPLIKFNINEFSYIYSYDLLSKLNLARVGIKVKANSVKNILAFSNNGQVDISNAFFPLGSIPKHNSSFIFGVYELLYKNITEIGVNLKWSDLPKGENGFEEHYRGYQNIYNNEIFKWKASILSNGKWFPEDDNEKQIINMFKSSSDDQSDNELLFNRKINKIIVKKYDAITGKINPEDFVYNYKTKNGFVKLELFSPEYSFGNHEYPIVLAKTVMENAKSKKKKNLPKPPYIPVIESINLNYKASSGFKPGSKSNKFEKMYIYNMLGKKELKLSEKEEENKIVPIENMNGNLFIGLTEVKKNEILNLFFLIRENSAENIINSRPAIKWFYLYNNEWTEFEDANVFNDTTNGLIMSGTISFFLSEKIESSHTIMPSGYFWIKGMIDKDFDIIGNLITIKTQAGKAVRKIEKDNESKIINIKAFSIEQTKSTITGLKGIYQLDDSKGGWLEENDEKLKIRISERLRHKKRAITTWDYERLILEQFPEIGKVKCFSNMSSQKLIDPGKVLIVVLPSFEINRKNNLAEPSVNNSILLMIKEYIEKLASPYCQIEVRNPIYDKIQIRCAVKFSESYTGGYGIQTLNSELIKYLSPWMVDYYDDPGFCKTISVADILGFIQNLDYVEFVTKFSMLQISDERKEYYYLKDTEKGNMFLTEVNKKQEQIKEFIPSKPWGIMISAENHIITNIDKIERIKPYQTGIGDMELEKTFILE